MNEWIPDGKVDAAFKDGASFIVMKAAQWVHTAKKASPNFCIFGPIEHAQQSPSPAESTHHTTVLDFPNIRRPKTLNSNYTKSHFWLFVVLKCMGKNAFWALRVSHDESGSCNTSSGHFTKKSYI